MTVGPLAGTTVLEFSSLIPGPYATALLLGYGAEVIKVEPPGGDPLRVMQPDMFQLVNRGKRSVVLDLKSDDGRQGLRTLLDAADVLLTSYRQSAQRRLSIDRDTATLGRPRLVHVSIVGFSEQDPRPGHDLNYLAEAGVVELFGLGREADRAVLTVPIADLGGAQFAAMSVLARLISRDQPRVDTSAVVSLQAAAAALTRTRVAEVLARPQDREIADTIAKPGYGTFQTADGKWIAIAALEDHYWAALAETLDLSPELAAMSYAARLAAVRDVNNAVEEAVAQCDAAELLDPETAPRLAATPVRSLDSEPLRLLVPGEPERPLPAIGELGCDTESVLTDLGRRHRG